MDYWKSLIILKEIKKPTGKFLRVWAKNQLRFEIFEKILKFTYKNLNGKLIFYLFSLPSSMTFVILSLNWLNWCAFIYTHHIRLHSVSLSLFLFNKVTLEETPLSRQSFHIQFRRVASTCRIRDDNKYVRLIQ